MLGSVGSKFITPVLKGTKTFARDYANIAFGVKQQDVFGRALNQSIKQDGFNNLGKNLSNAWSTSKDAVKGESLRKTLLESFTSIPKDIKAMKGAKILGAGGKLSQGLGLFSKRMPLVGVLLTVVTEVPNIVSSLVDKENGGGFVAALKETAKAGVKIGGMALGGLIGSAFIPPVGTIAGAMVGGWIAERIAGKSFTEKRDEKLAKAQEDQKVKNPQAGDVSEGNKAPEIPTFGGMTYNQDLSLLTPEEQKRYQQIVSAYQSTSSNPFGESSLMDMSLTGYNVPR